MVSRRLTADNSLGQVYCVSASHDQNMRARIAAILDVLAAGSALGEDTTAWHRTKAAIECHHDLLLDEQADDLIDAVVDHYITTYTDKFRTLSPDRPTEWRVSYPALEKRELLRRCRTVGVDAAFAERGEHLAEDWDIAFLNFLSMLSRIGGWPYARQLLERHAELLTADAQSFLAAAEQYRNTASEGGLTIGEVFGRIREVGIDVALADFEEFGTDVPPTLRGDLRTALREAESYRTSRDRMSLDTSAAAWLAMIEAPEFAAASLHTRRIYLVQAGNTFERRYDERGRIDDLDRAISSWRSAGRLASTTDDDLGSDFHYYLGVGLDRRSTLPSNSQAEKDLAEAIRHYETAYRVADSATSYFAPAPTDNSHNDAFAQWQKERRRRSLYLNAAGTTLLRQFDKNRNRSDVDQSVTYLRQAAELLEKERNGSVPAFLRDSLGQALEARYRAFGDAADLTSALDEYAAAVARAAQAPLHFGIAAAAHHGLLLFEVERWSAARAVLEKGHRWLEHSRRTERSHTGRSRFASFADDFYRALVASCLEEDDVRAAFYYASANKGRSFADLLTGEQATLDRIRAEHPEAHVDLTSYMNVREEIDRTWQELLALSLPPADLYDTLEQLADRELTLWDDIASRYRDLIGTGEASPLHADEARRLAAALGAALVEYYEHRLGWSAFVITADSITHHSLRFDIRLVEEIRDWVQTRPLRDAEGDPQPLLERAYDALIAPLLPSLRVTGRVFLAPCGPLHSLPFAAMRNRRTGQHLADEIELGMIPSLRTLATLANKREDSTLIRVAERPRPRVMTIAYAGDDDSPRYLENAVPEAMAVTSSLATAEHIHLLGESATPDAVVTHAPGQTVVHFSCHGLFDRRFPAQSGLLLSGGWLTVRRILTDLRLDGVELVTLGACETGEAHHQAGDELTGLGQAMLSAGATSVVAGLWQVDDMATRSLMSAFYARLADGQSPPRALRAAMIDLRGRVRWSHPYYWAPFMIMGLGAWP